jgi:hypothetical protein
MKRFLLELAVLLALLTFEIWNVGTARKRGAVFLKFRPISARYEAKDFKTAVLLNIVWIVVISVVTGALIHRYVSTGTVF